MHYHADMTKAGKYYHKLLSYLSTFFQSKLRRMTTGGAPGFASDCGVMPDRQGEVNTQHRPSAESKNAKEVKYYRQAYKQTEQILKLHDLHWPLSHPAAQAHPQTKSWSGSVGDPRFPRITAILQQWMLTLFTLCTHQWSLSSIHIASCFLFCSKNYLSEQEMYKKSKTLFYIKDIKIFTVHVFAVWLCEACFLFLYL